MLYGRFATSLRGGGSRAAISRCSASSQCSVGVRYPVEILAETAVDLDRVDRARRATRGSASARRARDRPRGRHPAGRARRTCRSRRGCCRRRGSAGRGSCAGSASRGLRSQPEDCVGVRVDLRRELGRIDVAEMRERLERVHDVRGLVRRAAHRLRREIGTVGLREQAVVRERAARPPAGRRRSCRSRCRRTRRTSRARAQARAGRARRSSGGSTDPSWASRRSSGVVVGCARVDHDRLARLDAQARAARRRAAAVRPSVRSRGSSRVRSRRPRRPAGARAARGACRGRTLCPASCGWMPTTA